MWVTWLAVRSGRHLFATAALATVAACGGPQPVTPSQSWGPTERGLRMGIATTNSVPSRGAELSVLFSHVSGGEVVLNLGYVLGNGQRFPTAISLVHTTPAGETCELKNGGSHVAGRVDPLILTIRGGGTYPVRVDLDQYWCRHQKVELAAGRHRMTATFRGTEGGSRNLDTPEIALLKFWTGRLESNVAEFHVPRRDEVLPRSPE